jgi:hypothetical protein
MRSLTQNALLSGQSSDALIIVMTSISIHVGVGIYVLQYPLFLLIGWSDVIQTWTLLNPDDSAPRDIMQVHEWAIQKKGRLLLLYNTHFCQE